MLKRAALVASCLMFLSGCGSYRPLYGTVNGTSVATALSSVSVEEQHTRAGQLLRNELLDGTHTGQQRYALSLTVTESTIDVAALSAKLGIRKRYVLSAHYEMRDQQNSKVMTSADVTTNTEFDTLNIPVADLQAASDARTRAAKQLGQDIKLRLAVFLANKQS